MQLFVLSHSQSLHNRTFGVCRYTKSAIAATACESQGFGGESMVEPVISQWISSNIAAWCEVTSTICLYLVFMYLESAHKLFPLPYTSQRVWPLCCGAILSVGRSSQWR